MSRSSLLELAPPPYSSSRGPVIIRATSHCAGPQRTAAQPRATPAMLPLHRPAASALRRAQPLLAAPHPATQGPDLRVPSSASLRRSPRLVSGAVTELPRTRALSLHAATTRAATAPSCTESLHTWLRRNLCRSRRRRFEFATPSLESSSRVLGELVVFELKKLW